MDADEDPSSGDELGITEQVLIDHVDILFQTSDVEESGYVPVSRIIEYLRIHTSFGENEEDLLSLVRLADPRGDNPSLTLERYREIMWQWIRQLQLGSGDSNDGGSEFEDFQSDSSNRVSSVSRSGSAKDPGGSSDLGFAKHDERFSIIENPSEEMQQYVDKIQELQFQNSKLAEENSTLQQQIYSQEESLAQSNTTNDSLVRKVKCLQEALQLRQQHDCENEEIILKLQDQKQEMKHKIDCLTSDVDHLRSSNKELEANVVEYQHQIEHMTEMKRVQEIQLSERYEELRNQQNQLLSLSTTVQEMRTENKDLQSKLCQSNEALKSLKQTAECEEKGDNLRRFPCSTPIKRNNSICMELRGVLEDGDHMPSPLCEKEIDEIDQVYPIFSSDEDTDNDNNPNISIYSVSLKDELTMDMSKFMEKYQSKQESLLDDIRHFLGTGASSGEGSFTNEFFGKLEDQMSKLSHKVSTLAQAKTDVDKRLCTEKKKFRKLKEENAVLKDAAVDVMEDQMSWDVITDKRLLILKDQIDQERTNIKFLEKKLKDKGSTFVNVDKNKKSGAEKVLKIEIQKLQSLNKDLTEKNKRLQGKVNSLAEEVEKSHRDVENEQTKVAKLEAEKAVLALERQQAENQLIEKNRQDLNQHSAMQESNMRSNHSLSLLHSDKVLRKVSQMSGVLPYDLLLTQNHLESKEHPKSKSTSQNNVYTDTRSENERQSLEHLWLDRGRISEEEFRDMETEEDENLDCCYRGDGQRRYSYQAAIDNQNCLPGEQRYPRCRSGSFQAAIEGGQKEGDHGQVSENLTQLISSRSTATENVDSYHSIVPSYNHLDDCLVSTKTSHSQGASSYSQNSSQVCYSVCDSVQTAGTVGCSGDFTVNSSYLTCTDTSHNHCDVMIKQFSSCHDDVTNTQNDDGSRLFGTRWRDTAEDSGCTLEDSSLKHRSGDLSDSPAAPDVIQITKLGKISTDDRKELMSPKVSIPSSSSTTAGLNSSSDYRTCKEHIRTEGSPTTEAGKEMDRCVSEVKEERSEVKDTKIKDKEEVNDVVDAKVKEEVNEKIDPVKGEDRDDENVDVTNNLIKQLEKLNLSDCPTHCELLDDLSPSSPHLKKIRQGNLAKRREQMKFLRMPDLNEHQESGQMMTNGDGESDSSVMPSIPETLLQDLGVDQDKTEEESPDQLSEQELENKFTSLSLAFKTDKITLEKRLEIQERSRDIAEENVSKEVKGLKEALEQLNQICVDSQVRGLLLKIQKHVAVLEQASARVSSRAEVFGAVQQEKRMSKAIEIMLTHVDNLRMSHERQTAELEEARKLIQDNRPFGGSTDLGDFVGLSRRSASVCHSNTFLPKGARRRVSDAALTRSGLPHSASVDNISESVHVMPPLRRDLAISLSEEDPRSKFQQIASVAALKNSTSSAFRKASLCKQTSTSSLLGQNLRLAQENSQSDSKTTRSISKQHSAEEEAFQKGFEQGYKAQITGQLKQLRDQQNSITDTLDEIRDKCEEAEEGDTQEISLRDTIVSKVWEHIPEWGTASKNLRLATVVFFLFLAAVSIILSFLPVGYAAVQVYPEYHHVNSPPV